MNNPQEELHPRAGDSTAMEERTRAGPARSRERSARSTAMMMLQRNALAVA
jgi:hypothetical protein